MVFFLNIVYLVLLLFYVPALWRRGKLHKGYRERLGGISPQTKRRLADKKHIWVHAVSVGEIVAVKDLISQLSRQSENYPVVCTVVTKTGYQLAQKVLDNDVCVLYAPLDFSWIVKKFIRIIQPHVYISAETEWWPNMYHYLKKEKVPIIQINGRISDKAFDGYKKISFITKRVIQCVDLFLMQSEAQKKRVIELGADSRKVEVLGNLKFDNLVDSQSVCSEFRIKENILWVAGSTHPGEEELILESYAQIKQKIPHVRLILCPRHVERGSDVIRIVERHGYQPIYFSKWNRKDFQAHEVVVVDTIGHLSELYSIAKVVFIGKTFKVGGGQNMIESANFGVPTVVGPYTSNFQQVMEIFLEEGGIVQIQDPQELANEIEELLTNSVRYNSIGAAAKRVVDRYKGATSKTFHRLQVYL